MVLRLVRALQTLVQQVPTTEFAVIGGLAVMVRLQGAHRVTDDLDTVATQHGDDPTRVEIVTGIEGAVEGTKVDCIAVGDVPAAELHGAELPDDELDRAFVLSHRWALDSAENRILRADDLELSATVDCRFASAAALVAMKLQSSPRRKGDRSYKAGGDLFDIFRLISNPELTRAIAVSLHTAPHDLGSWCAASVAGSFVDQSDRSAAAIARSGVAGARSPTSAELRRAGELLVHWFEDTPP
ncbi:MAG: nucleotidyl transferase AbiEii/AbiGii toxin family protein [Acidimicrobiales bacterium]